MVDSEENHLLPYGPIDEVEFEDIANQTVVGLQEVYIVNMHIIILKALTPLHTI